MSNVTTAREIVRFAGLQERPEHYKGRVAKYEELNSERLAKIYHKIWSCIGYQEARAFVEMMKKIKLLSTKKFLESLYALEINGWCFSEEIQKEIDAKKENYARLQVIYECREGGINDTEYIRNMFLLAINEKYDWKVVYLEGSRFRRRDLDIEDDWDDNDDYVEYD